MRAGEIKRQRSTARKKRKYQGGVPDERNKGDPGLPPIKWFYHSALDRWRRVAGTTGSIDNGELIAVKSP